MTYEPRPRPETRDERIAWLKDYAEELENELKNARERLKELEAA